ncbi:MAG: glycosyltransferase family 4 protein [Chloroflexi bacterium]|nr:glycosyltransferase family 4 protein [Chloroflexota bacterium]
MVYYISDHGRRLALDKEFGETFKWDTPLDQGYVWKFLPGAEGRSPYQQSIQSNLTLATLPFRRTADVFLFLIDYSSLSAVAFLYSAVVNRIPILYRGDTTLIHERQRLKQLKRLVLGQCFRQNVWGLYVGTLARDYMMDLGVPPGRLVASPHCVDSLFWSAYAGECTSTNNRNKIRAKFGLPIDRPVVLFCGKVIDVKRPLDLARAMCRLASERPVSLLVAGNGNQMDAMKAIVASSPNLVTGFLGFMNQSELPEVYTAADVICLPSQSETWGLVINEAMYFGCVPVVSNHVGCAPDLVEGIGEVYPVGDIDGLVTSIVRVLDNLSERRSRIPARIAQFSVDRAVDGIVEAAMRASGVC